MPPKGWKPESAKVNRKAQEKSAQHLLAMARFQENATRDLDEIYLHLRDLAFGLWREVVNEEGVKRVYQQPPDRQALDILLSHAKGKPAVAQAVQQDTTVVLVSKVPRPGKGEGDAPGAK